MKVIIVSLGFIMILIAGGANAGRQLDLVQPFFESLPYRVAVFGQLARHGISVSKGIGPCAGFTDDGGYHLLRSSICFEDTCFYYYFPTQRDSCVFDRMLLPSGDTLVVHTNDRPLAKSNEDVSRLTPVFDSYHTLVEDFAKARVGPSTRWVLAKSSASILLGGAYTMLIANGGDVEITLGVIGGILLIRTVLDDWEDYKTYFKQRSRRKTLVRELQAWDETQTHNILDSLTTEIKTKE